MSEEDFKEAKRLTGRPTVLALEELLGQEIKILDKGFIRVIDYMGNDESIVQAARVSYGAGTKHVSQDKALINYLIRHNHTSPFEMCEIKFHVKLPIFVARQWVRHRTANLNEYSARYSIVEEEFYVPEKKDIAFQSKNNAQGRSETVPEDTAESFIKQLNNNIQACYKSYNNFLNQDIARELARITIPLNNYTQWYWKTDLHNLLHFINLRADKQSQLEIRSYGEKIAEIVEKWVPLTYASFTQHKKESITFSKNALKLLKAKLKGKNLTAEECDISKREFKEIQETFATLEGD